MSLIPSRTPTSWPRRLRSQSSAAVAFCLTAFFVAAGAPTPLLVIYQDRWGFSSWLLTLAFGVYALGLLGSLLVLGSLSDYVGRRPLLIGSLFLELAAMLMFLLAPGIGWIVAARIVQGVATGAATGAFTAAIVELAPPRRKPLATLLGSASPAGGLGLGALLAGAVAQVSDHASAVVWVSMTVVMIVCLLIALATPETIANRAGARESLRPHIAVPVRARSQFIAAVPVLVGAWMVAALFMGLVPTILGNVFDIHSPLADGSCAFIEPGTAAMVALLVGRTSAHRSLLLGGVAVVIGSALVVLAVTSAVLPLLWAGGAIGGVGFGATLSGAIRALVPEAAEHERAGLFAAIYLVAYLAFGVPAIVAGQLVVPLGLVCVAVGFGMVTIVTAGVGLGSQFRMGRLE